MQRKKKLIHGLKFDEKPYSLPFALWDDSLIFIKASIKDCKHLKKIFNCYAAASRQLFNFEKFSMFFSGKVSGEQVAAIKIFFST